MNVSIAIIIGLGSAAGAAGVISLIGRGRLGASRAPALPKGASRPAPMHGLLPSLLHPHLVDATASEFDDIRRPRFTPVSLLTESEQRVHPAPAKGS